MSGFDDRNVIGLLAGQVEERFEGSWASEISLYNPNSASAEETYGLFGGFAKMREWVGARQANTINKRQYTVRNKKYESTLVVSNDDLTRDKSTLLAAYLGSWVDGTIMSQWEDLITDLINANGLCVDGQNFFDTDHQFGSETAQKNALTASEVTALNIGTATDPTPAEIAAAVLGLVGWLLTLKDDKDRYINGNARSFTVAVSTINLWSPLMQALNSNLLTGIVDNPLNGLKVGGFTFKPLLLPALTSATAKIRVFRNDAKLKPFLLQEEKGIQYKRLAAGSDFEFENDAMKIGVNTNRGAGYGIWQYAVEGTLS